MTTEFTQLNLDPELVQAVAERGYVTPTPIQEAIIPVMLSGSDVIGQAQTGTGKTAAFALPMIQSIYPGLNHVQGLVLAPTRELALQVAEAIAEYGQFSHVRVLAVYGGAAYTPQIRALKRGAEIVVGTPGRLLDLIHKNILDISQVHSLVLDEADEMLSMGFIEDIEAILAATPSTRQTALFSATLPPEIRRLAEKYMHTPQSITIQREQVTVAAIEQRYYLINASDRLAALTRLFEMEEVTSALVFARTRVETGELASELTLRGFPAEVLNGDLNQDARERTLRRFRDNQVKVLVATDVAARGLDIDDISHVFNYNLPDDPELYVHRIGRTGRAGKTGIAITLVSPYEKRRLRQVEDFTRQRVPKATLPTEDEIRVHREERLVEKVGVWLKRGRFSRERELVDQLVEAGHDPLDVASAALRLIRAEEKQRPIAPISDVAESRPRRDDRQRSDRGDRGDRFDRGEHSSYPRGGEVSHEAGMVRLSLNVGWKQGIRPNDIVGAIAAHAEIPGRAIGKIHIQEKYSLFDVPEELVGQVLAKAGEVRIRRQAIAMQRA